MIHRFASCMACLALAAVVGASGSSRNPWPRHVIDDSSRGADGIRLADVNGDGLPDITTGWEEGGTVRVYLNPGPTKAKEKWPAVTVGHVGDVEDAVFVDLDGDGTLDLVFSCEGAKPPLHGLMWLSCTRPLATGTWVPHVLSGADGIKHDLIGIVDFNGDGRPDVITTEESAGERRTGLGVIWYENSLH
jgi:hypothetical protein